MPIDRPALLVQLQPITPWRCGAGHRDEPASLVPSDSLFGAICDAMLRLGWLPEWLESGTPSARMTSLLPFQSEVYYAPLPESLRSTPGLRRVRLESVRFATLRAIQELAARQFDENRWVLDLPSGCLLPADRAGAGGPYRTLERQRVAVDRWTGESAVAASTQGVEFATHSGAWGLFVFPDAEAASVWSPRIKAAFRLLADDGIGGWRVAGWGRSRRPRFREGDLDRLLTNLGWKHAAPEVIESQKDTKWWTLGLFAPGSTDQVDWTSGAYRTMMRSGWTATEAKPELRLVREGSILSSPATPTGRISESIVEGAAHPILRYAAGLALPWQEVSES